MAHFLCCSVNYFLFERHKTGVLPNKLHSISNFVEIYTFVMGVTMNSAFLPANQILFMLCKMVKLLKLWRNIIMNGKRITKTKTRPARVEIITPVMRRSKMLNI